MQKRKNNANNTKRIQQMKKNYHMIPVAIFRTFLYNTQYLALPTQKRTESHERQDPQ